MSIYKNGKLVAGGRQCTPLLSYMWADHRLDEASWLRADTFSWHSGAVYQAVFNHLNNEYVQGALYAWGAPGSYVYTKSNEPSVGDWIYDVNGNRNATYPTVTSVASGYGSISYSTDSGGGHYDYTFGRDSAGDTTLPLESETIEGITVQFCLAADGHKICPASEEDKVLSIYNKTGNAWYYIIDRTNQKFKLPRRHSQQIVRSVKNTDGSWYRLYADGWVEQGGIYDNGSLAESFETTITMPVVMSNNMYSAIATASVDAGSSSYTAGSTVIFTHSTTQLGVAFYRASSGCKTRYLNWCVSGQSAMDMSSFQDNEKHLYFYVGNFTQTALENTAGLNAELFNGKADVSTVAHVVTEFQEPTAANNYTWYRKYADGWVEQGGIYNTAALTYLIPMADINYTMFLQPIDTSGKYAMNCQNLTTTGANINTEASQWHRYSWQVSGMAA